ncbi:MAG: WD40 repeat domain-containing protein [Verrucomicrobia bacterium]|nr:WD40 repeat domain-containing protein [Verrucomicrobiota bacterium]
MNRPIRSVFHVFHVFVSVSLMMSPLLATGNARALDYDRILWTTEWNHDGSRFAVGGVNTLWVFDSNTLERKSLLPKTPGVQEGDINIPYVAVTSVSWHPSGILLAVSSQGRDVNGVYDIVSGDRTPLKVDQGRGVSWSPDGARVALSSSGNGHLGIWKSDGTLLHNISRYEKAKGLTGVSWRPSGDRIVTIGGQITLHDAQGKPIRQMTHRPETEERLCLLLCVEWHPSGEFFAVGDYGNEVDDPVIQFWSADGELLKSVTIQGGAEIRNISWNHDGSLLASASEKLRIWTKDGRLKHESESPDLLWGVSWHPKGDKILTSSIEGRVTLWSPTAKVIKEIIVPAR